MVRLKTRYLLFEVLYPEGPLNDPSNEIQSHVDLRQPSKKEVDGKLLVKLVRQSIQQNFGEFGTGKTASTLAIKYFSPTTNTGIARVSRQHFRLVWAALSYINEINGRKCIVSVVRVSGTIKKCEQAAIARNKKNIDNALTRFTDDLEEMND